MGGIVTVLFQFFLAEDWEIAGLFLESGENRQARWCKPDIRSEAHTDTCNSVWLRHIRILRHFLIKTLCTYLTVFVWRLKLNGCYSCGSPSRNMSFHDGIMLGHMNCWCEVLLFPCQAKFIPMGQPWKAANRPWTLTAWRCKMICRFSQLAQIYQRLQLQILIFFW